MTDITSMTDQIDAVLNDDDGNTLSLDDDGYQYGDDDSSLSIDPDDDEVETPSSEEDEVQPQIVVAIDASETNAEARERRTAQVGGLTTDHLVAYTDRDLPWMQLGAQLPNGVTSAEQAARLGGLDFEVDLRPAAFPSAGDQGWMTVPSRFACVRKDTEAFFDFVSKDYTPVQYAEAFAFLDSLSDHGVEYVAAGTPDGFGRQAFIVVQRQPQPHPRPRDRPHGAPGQVHEQHRPAIVHHQRGTTVVGTTRRDEPRRPLAGGEAGSGTDEGVRRRVLPRRNSPGRVRHPHRRSSSAPQVHPAGAAADTRYDQQDRGGLAGVADQRVHPR
jgi:hypothetical protein